MDTKKNLKPELKEIYERVMSTKSAPRNTSPTDQSKVTPTASSVTPAAPTEKPKSESITPPAATPTPQPNSAPAPTTPPQVKQDPYLPSSAPRAIAKDTGAFVFSSHGKNNVKPPKEEKKSEPAHTNAVSPEKKGDESKKSGKSLIPVLLVVMAIFLVIYTVFWAIFFNII